MIRSTFLSAFGICLLAALSTAAGDVPGAEKAGLGLQPGTHFATKLFYSSYWERNDLQPPDDPRRRPEVASQSADPRTVEMPEVVSQSADPLTVEMVLCGALTGDGVLRLTPKISRIRYFDSTGRSWDLEAGKRNFASRAADLIHKVALDWRHNFRNAQGREMAEEQLLGCAIALLHGSTIDVELESRNDNASFPTLDAVLDKVLPDAFPRSLRAHVSWFLRESVARTLAPRPARLGARARFTCRGVPYTVESVGKTGKRRAAQISGQEFNAKDGVAFKERATFDVESGLVLKGASTTIHDAARGSAARMASVRWRTELAEVRRDRGKVTK